MVPARDRESYDPIGLDPSLGQTNLYKETNAT